VCLPQDVALRTRSLGLREKHTGVCKGDFGFLNAMIDTSIER